MTSPSSVLEYVPGGELARWNGSRFLLKGANEAPSGAAATGDDDGDAKAEPPTVVATLGWPAFHHRAHGVVCGLTYCTCLSQCVWFAVQQQHRSSPIIGACVVCVWVCGYVGVNVCMVCPSACQSHRAPRHQAREYFDHTRRRREARRPRRVPHFYTRRRACHPHQ